MAVVYAPEALASKKHFYQNIFRPLSFLSLRRPPTTTRFTWLVTQRPTYSTTTEPWDVEIIDARGEKEKKNGKYEYQGR
jgi:hypothetical protein